MRVVTRLALAWCVAALLLAPALGEPGGEYPRPRRPERFETADQISEYLRELQEYYSVHGRGRYGKRQSRTPELLREIIYGYI